MKKTTSRKRIVHVEPDWIQMYPHGISVNSHIGRPVLILKDQNGMDVLPVWIQPLEAGVAIAELSDSHAATPHVITSRMLEALDLKLVSCCFTELIGHHQFVNITLKSAQGQHTTFRVRASEAMSFCLHNKAQFYSTKKFNASCRDLDADLAQFEVAITQGTAPGVKSLREEMEIGSKKHPYMM